MSNKVLTGSKASIFVNGQLVGYFKEVFVSTDATSKMDLSGAVGDDLDKIAEMFGIKRHAAVSPNGNPVVETDEEVRQRVRSFALGGDGHVMDSNQFPFADPPVGLVPFEFDDDKTPVIAGPKCECGAAALGYTQPGPGHAFWCPISTK